MKKIAMLLLPAAAALAMASCSKIEGDVRFAELPDEPLQPWSLEKARDWHASQPWIVGCNYFPSTAINQIEMWQSSSYDHQTNDRELGWAAELGFNTVRVFLHSYVWEKEHDAFFANLDDFLAIADSHGIKAMICFFAGSGEYLHRCNLGKQLDPVEGVHNLDFKGDPAVFDVDGKVLEGRIDLMKRYVQEVVARYANDDRVRIWEAWNEPGTYVNHEDITTELLPVSIQWIREMNPLQPITVGIHSPDLAHAYFDEVALTMSDINSYHNYNGWEYGMKNIALAILAYGRPVICSEYLGRGSSRGANCYFENTLPQMKQYGIGALNWGLVWGKTNTIYTWDSTAANPQSDPWWHDILLPDGTPKYPEEKEFLREITGVAGQSGE